MKPSCLDLLIVCALGFIFPLCLKETHRLIWSYMSVWTEQQHGCRHQHNGPPSSTTHDCRSFSTPDKVHKAINAYVMKAGLFSEPLHMPIISVYFSDSLAKKRFAFGWGVGMTVQRFKKKKNEKETYAENIKSVLNFWVTYCLLAKHQKYF